MPKIDISTKVNYTSLPPELDFYSLFKKVSKRFDTCFLYESLGEHGSASRYSLIGFDPDKIVGSSKNSFDKLKRFIPQHDISRGYAGGLVGYLSYECVSFFEPKLKVKTHPLFDQFFFGVYTDGLVLDKTTNELKYFYQKSNRVEIVKELLREQLPPEEVVKVEYLGDTLDEVGHGLVVEKIKKEILAGNIFQCEVGFKSEYRVKGKALAIYSKLREINPSPYMFYLQHKDEVLLGASPELLLKITDREMETSPLAGTIKRGQTIEEDRQLARILLSDEKERAEHIMLVDMHRNDIGRAAKFGTVKIKSLMDIKKYSHVQHISSTIGGILREGEDMFSALRAIFPGGVLSGTPKVEAIKIIDANEPVARGPYGGAVGFFGFNGDCTFVIPIRSLFIKGDYGFTQTSSGIVYDSAPEKEYAEVKNKLAAMRQVLENFETSKI
ncbi:MAG: anthranilate synthase component I family protein [Patescibacteria group bacterium]